MVEAEPATLLRFRSPQGEANAKAGPKGGRGPGAAPFGIAGPAASAPRAPPHVAHGRVDVQGRLAAGDEHAGGSPDFREPSNMVDPIINALVFFDRAPELDAVEDAVEKHLWPCVRFRSRIEDGHWVDDGLPMDRPYHFRERRAADETEVDAFVQEDIQRGLDPGMPRWTVTIVHVPPPARSAMWIRIHHCIGDGIGLLYALSPLIGCEGGVDPLSTVPLPSALLPRSARKPRARPPTSEEDEPIARGPLAALFGALRQFFRGLVGPLLIRADSELKINPPLSERTPFMLYNGDRAVTRFPTIPMALVKAARARHGCSVNDALLAALAGALRRYGAEVRGDGRLQVEGGSPEPLVFQSMLMLALPRKVDEEDLTSALRNNMLFASCPLPIDEPSAQGRLRRVVEACNQLKSMPYLTGLVSSTKTTSAVFPTRTARALLAEYVCKHSLLVTNVPAMMVPITFPKDGGDVVREIQMVFPNIIPQFSIMTLNQNVHANLVADPALFPSPRALGELWEIELRALAR